MLTQKDLLEIKKTVEAPLQKKLSSMDKKLKSMDKKLKSMDKKLDTVISYFDRETTDHAKRIKRLEKHTRLPPYSDVS